VKERYFVGRHWVFEGATIVFIVLTSSTWTTTINLVFSQQDPP
jgi:hypothetical protein